MLPAVPRSEEHPTLPGLSEADRLEAFLLALPEDAWDLYVAELDQAADRPDIAAIERQILAEIRDQFRDDTAVE